MRTAGGTRRNSAMRCPALLLALSFFSPTLLACENQLIGTWQSDADATMSFNRAHAKLEKRQDDFLASLIGKMTLEFTRGELHLRMPETEVRVQGKLKPFDSFEERKPYRTLFCSQRMAVIETKQTATEEKGVTTYFFIGPDAMWVYGGTNDPKVPDLHIREYFRRIR
ncbi:hypothetical protein FCE95_11290 [Luteimonas gilva]|uniref:TIGR03067 domain-containing protein n=1 Tax=Luteimonas gilva TaxID=2572684 RepID=A0A4U5JM16_9GAMM|nr:hypothetical protein [Luteimonas gilva]TKR30682.1 hypothetical protein FCE95_11290 [Luteimonas gilva]